MIATLLLGTTLYLTPVATNGGDFGNYGMKFTDKINDGIYLKIRVFDKPCLNEQPQPTIKAYIDFDF